MTQDTSSDPHRMRITTGGSIANYVRFALTFLEQNPSRPLVLHTLPPADAPRAAGSSSSSSSTLDPATLAAPRLISVVEKIKREYCAGLRDGSIKPNLLKGTRLGSDPKPKGKAKGGDTGKEERLGAPGIWQYTESGLVAECDMETLSLERVLEGNKKPKMTHRPYLQITLSTTPLNLEQGSSNITCQFETVGRRRRGAKRESASKPAAQDGSGGEKEGSASVSEEDMGESPQSSDDGEVDVTPPPRVSLKRVGGKKLGASALAARGPSKHGVKRKSSAKEVGVKRVRK